MLKIFEKCQFICSEIQKLALKIDKLKKILNYVILLKIALYE